MIYLKYVTEVVGKVFERILLFIMHISVLVAMQFAAMKKKICSDMQ